MNINETVRIHSRRLRVIAAGALLAGSLVAAPARAIDVLGFYLGAGIGQSEVAASEPSFSASSFKENHTAWKAVAGVRPISLLGAELAYIDFGSPTGVVQGVNAKVDLKATALYGLFYLPIPAPFIDVYGKAGYARLDGTLSATTTSGAFQASVDDDGVTAGAGAQFKLGSWAIRGEYERFMVSGSDPSLLSVSVTKTFF
jgi:hypothetical protein